MESGRAGAVARYGQIRLAAEAVDFKQPPERAQDEYDDGDIQSRTADPGQKFHVVHDFFSRSASVAGWCAALAAAFLPRLATLAAMPIAAPATAAAAVYCIGPAGIDSAV